jgi:hypothetical protein
MAVAVKGEPGMSGRSMGDPSATKLVGRAMRGVVDGC